MITFDLKTLKEKVNVVALLKHYNFENISVERDWVKAKCVYHDDSDPSFSMRQGDTYFHCWSCKVSGDAIKLIMDFENTGFREATNTLAKLAGYVQDGNYQLEYLKQKLLAPKDQKKEENVLIDSPRLWELNRLASQFFEKSLIMQSVPQNYLASRNFSKYDAMKFEIGYHPTDSCFLENDILEGEFSEGELKVAGFITEYGERFSTRLMFPIYDLRGNVVAFSGRALEENQEPKYTATPNSDFYKKGHFLFGLQHVQAGKPIVLVEGNLDCVRLQINGINSLAQLGTALTPQQCRLLKSLTNEVTLLYDGDEAGVKTSYSSILPLVEAGLLVRVGQIPTGFDPDTYTAQYGVELLMGIINRSARGLSVIMHSDCTVGKSLQDILTTLLKSIRKIDDKIIKEQYVKEVADIFGYSQDSIRVELKKAAQ